MSEPQAASEMTVWALPLPVGACSASVQSIFALHAPRYTSAMRQRNISFVRSPRHADIALVAGVVTRAAFSRVRRLLASIPQPRAIIAVGNCAIDGCIFQGSPRLVANAAGRLGANVEIAGCPPAPEAILSAIMTAQRLLAGKDAPQTYISQPDDMIALRDSGNEEDEA
jgi:formate hydrogenlyase subunit 7